MLFLEGEFSFFVVIFEIFNLTNTDKYTEKIFVVKINIFDSTRGTDSYFHKNYYNL